MDVAAFNFIGALAALGGQILLAGIVLGLVLERFDSRPAYLAALGRNGLWLAFFVTLAGVLGSLYYSEIAGYEPCSLCWWQRIFLYPQVVLLGMALAKRDTRIIDYALVLAVLGALIAGYHTTFQFTDTVLPCPAGGGDCGKLFVHEFGYITIPVMSLTMFLVIIASLLLAFVRQRLHPKGTD